MIATLILLAGTHLVTAPAPTNQPEPVSIVIQPTALLSARLAALGMIETGNVDNPHTPDISRYGISKPVWKEYTSLPFNAAANPVTAGAVAVAIMHDRCWRFAAKTGRPPTDAEWYCLWHRPEHATRMHQQDVEIGERFTNLVKIYNDPDQLPGHK